MRSRRRYAFVVPIAFVSLTIVGSCGGGTSPSGSSDESRVTTSVSPSTAEPPQSISPTQLSNVLFDFPDSASVEAWSNVDDSVMGGISSSTSTWIDTGGMIFSGKMTTESNGGFTSVLGPAEQRLGARSADAGGIGVDAIGDGRTYVLQLRAGIEGRDRWIARFTPLTYSNRSAGNTVMIPFDSFQSVDRFLRATAPSTPLDPSTILQIGIYLIDGQVGQFRLAVISILAVP